jgi:general secretion pathway protein M
MATTLRPSAETRVMRSRQWWQLRSPAERSILLLCGAAVAAVAAWALLWEPLARDTELLERRVADQRAALAAARAQADEIATLGRNAAAPPPRDARADVESALARNGLKATAIDRGDDQRLRVTLDAVSFDALAALLDGLQRDARLSAVELTAAARVEPGQVRVEMTLAPPR